MIQSVKTPQVLLCLRVPVTLSAYERQQSIQKRLRTLRDEGHIDELSVRIWEKQIPADGAGLTDSEIHARIQLYEQFQSWADQAGYSLEPAFSRHEIDFLVTDEQQEVIRFPIICLAVYDGDELVDLAPRSAPHGAYTAGDFIAALEPSEREPVGAVSSDAVESP